MSPSPSIVAIDAILATHRHGILPGWVQALHERAVELVQLLRVRRRHGHPCHVPRESLLVGGLRLLYPRGPVGELLVELGLDALVLRGVALVDLRLYESLAALGAAGGHLRFEEPLLPAADLDGVVVLYLGNLLELDLLDLRDDFKDVRAHLTYCALELLCR